MTLVLITYPQRSLSSLSYSLIFIMEYPLIKPVLNFISIFENPAQVGDLNVEQSWVTLKFREIKMHLYQNFIIILLCCMKYILCIILLYRFMLFSSGYYLYVTLRNMLLLLQNGYYGKIIRIRQYIKGSKITKVLEGINEYFKLYQIRYEQTFKDPH